MPWIFVILVGMLTIFAFGFGYLQREYELQQEREDSSLPEDDDPVQLEADVLARFLERERVKRNK